MANIKSQKKRIITAEKARMRNKAGKLLDKAASKGIIHKNQAAQRKSGVQKLVNKIK